jgi:hypothetical protein
MQERLLRCSKPLVLLVRLVPVAILLWRQLSTQLLQDGPKQLLPAGFVVGITVPDGNLHSVPADRV